jgi:hypothetical protein
MAADAAQSPLYRSLIAALVPIVCMSFNIVALLEMVGYYIISRRFRRAPGSQPRTDLSGKLPVPVFDPDDPSLNWKRMRQEYVDRGIPIVLRRANGLPISTVTPPISATDDCISGCIRVINTPWLGALPGMDEVVAKLCARSEHAHHAAAPSPCNALALCFAPRAELAASLRGATRRCSSCLTGRASLSYWPCLSRHLSRHLSRPSLTAVSHGRWLSRPLPRGAVPMTPRAYWPFWFLGKYAQGKAHVDLGPHTVNVYFLRTGVKDVVIVPPEVTRNVALETGCDGLYITDSEEPAREYLLGLPYYYHVDLQPQSILVFNNASCIHQFRNVQNADGTWPQALSLRVKHVAACEPRVWSHLMTDVKMSWRFTGVFLDKILLKRVHCMDLT